MNESQVNQNNRNKKTKMIPIRGNNERTRRLSKSKSDIKVFGNEVGLWRQMQEKLDRDDDFFCIPSNNAEDLIPSLPRRRTICINPSEANEKKAPKEDEIDHITGIIPQYIQKNKDSDMISIDIPTVLRAVSEEIGVFLSELQQSLVKTSELAGQITDINKMIHDKTDLCRLSNRRIAVLPLMCQNQIIKKCKKNNARIQKNIRIMAALQDYLSELKDVDGYVLYEPFKKKFINFRGSYPTIDKRISSIKSKILSSRFQNVSDEYSKLTDPLSKSGRIIQRFRNKICEMYPADFDVVFFALNQMSLPNLQSMLFDIAWQMTMFPFTDIQPYTMPQISHLSPYVFDPNLIPEPFISCTFSELSNTKWPYSKASDYFLEMLVERNPFIIASRFWECFQYIGSVAKSIYPNLEEIEFDSLFSLLLSLVFVFGVGELIEMMMFSVSFESLTSNHDQLFAMSHMNGLISYISKINPILLEQRMRKKQSILP